MKALRIAVAILTLAATLGMAGGVAASTSHHVTITVVTQIYEGESFPFVATGGVVCTNGNVSNGDSRFEVLPSGTRALIVMVKQFECPNGTFDILLVAILDFSTGDTVGLWRVIDGTGAYRSLHGNGSLTGDKTDPDAESILDMYSGQMRNR